MKKIYFTLITLLSLPVFGQIQHDINKTSGTESNPITEIDSIRFNGSMTEMEVVLDNGNVESHTMSVIDNVTFSGQLIGEITSLDCANATITGTLVEGTVTSAVSADIDYTGGNGGVHNGQIVNSNGVTGLTAELTAGNFANGAGTLTYTISGTPSASGTASFAIQIGGMSCTLEITVDVGSISTLDCAAATINGTLVDGIAASGVSVDIGYTGGNNGSHNGQTVNSTGVTGLTAELNAGNFANGTGTLTYTVEGTPNSNGTATFVLNIGGVTCNLEVTVNGGKISTLECNDATINGNLIIGVSTNALSVAIEYTGGNGGPHNGQVVISTGVTGLTAALTPATFLIGNGTLTYIITGTPSSDGTANFSILIGGEACNLSLTVYEVGVFPSTAVHCNGTPTTVVDITNPATGETWMDRNLGASQQAISNSDANSFGDFYQWGRGTDGHQCRNSPVTSVLSSTDQPGHGDFIITSSSPSDWRSPQNSNLWQGVSSINNPCPTGYRLPTVSELDAERQSWSSNDEAGAFNSPLKWSAAGRRLSSNLILNGTGHYWSSTVSGTGSYNLVFQSSFGGCSPCSQTNLVSRATGYSVRCIKD